MLTGAVDPASTVTLAQQLVTVLAEADPETRRRAIAAALALLGDASTGNPPDSPRRGGNDLGDLGTFFSREDALKPADNAYLCAAYHYARYGPTPFSLQDLREIAGEAGVVIPDRLDMTLKQAGKGGKKLFQSVGKDSYRPTAIAGMTFKERWGVTPGRHSKPGKES
jgi:hypothetical protein